MLCFVSQRQKVTTVQSPQLTSLFLLLCNHQTITSSLSTAKQKVDIYKCVELRGVKFARLAESSIFRSNLLFSSWTKRGRKLGHKKCTLGWRGCERGDVLTSGHWARPACLNGLHALDKNGHYHDTGPPQCPFRPKLWPRPCIFWARDMFYECDSGII